MRKNWEDDYVSPESLDSYAYEELSQRLYEYNKTVNGQDEQSKTISEQDKYISLEKQEKQNKRNRITMIISFVAFAIIIAFFLYIELNFDALSAKYLSYSYRSNTKKEHTGKIISIAINMLAPAIPYIVALAVIGIIGILVYFSVKAKKNPKSIDDYLKINEVKDENLIRDGFTPQNFHPESFADPDQKPSPYIAPNNYTSEIMVFMQSTDQTFDSMEFIEWSKKCFRIFWDAWTVGNLEAARIFLSDDLYEKMRSLYNDNLAKNRKDIYKIFSLVGCFINKYERESGFEYITVYMSSIHRHYVLDARRNSNIPIEGSISQDLRTIYQLKFMRRFTIDQETKIKDGIQTVICPNCGAEVTALNAGRCEFCNSVIKVSEFSWVLSDIDEYLRNTSLVDNRGVVIHNVKF